MNFRPLAATVGLLATVGLAAFAQNEPANWALDRIDQRQLPLDHRYTGRTGGDGVTIYIVDTGVRMSHPEFGHRAQVVGEFVTGSPGGRDGDDCSVPDGHGTLNASLAAGASFGVAPHAALQVLRAAGGATCTGDPNAVMRAVDWITSHGQKPAVVNISFRFAHEGLNAAIHRSIRAGYVYTLSAGTAGDVTKYWGTVLPGEALIAAGTDASDTPLRDDYGPALTIFAPAVSVTGAGLRDEGRGFTPTREKSGDSYAAPIVAGVAALYLERHPTASPAEVRRAIIDAATTGVVKGAGQSPNRLLHLTGS